MRKLQINGLAVALAATLLVALPATAAPAIIYHGGNPCGMPGAGADGHIMFGGIGVATHETRNDNVVILTCQGDDILNLSGTAQHHSGYQCGILVDGEVRLSRDSSATIAPNGRATSRCAVSLAEGS